MWKSTSLEKYTFRDKIQIRENVLVQAVCFVRGIHKDQYRYFLLSEMFFIPESQISVIVYMFLIY